MNKNFTVSLLVALFLTAAPVSAVESTTTPPTPTPIVRRVIPRPSASTRVEEVNARRDRAKVEAQAKREVAKKRKAEQEAKRKARAEAKRQCLAERKAAETVYKKAIREAEAVFKKEMAEARKNKDEAAKKAATEKLREAKVAAKKAWGASKEATKALCRQGEATNLSSFFGSWLSF